jgi:hypothetical protein
MSVERLAGQIRATEEGALPSGEHMMTLDSVEVMARKKGGFGLRIISRHQSGQTVHEWRNLSSDIEDAYKLTDGQKRGLREFAQRFNITETEPNEIVSSLRQSVGAAVQVMVKQTPHSRIVKHSAPQGIRLRTDAGALTVSGEVVEPDDAYEMEKRLKAALRLTRRSLLAVGEECHNISRGHAYEALGYETLAEFLAQPEVGMSRSEFFTAAKIHEVFVLEHGIEPDRLAEAGMAKLAVVLPKVTAGEIEAETAVADASTNGLRDLRDEYREPRESTVDQTPNCPRCGCIPDEVLDPLRIKWEAV